MKWLLRILCAFIGSVLIASAIFKFIAPEGFEMEVFAVFKNQFWTNFISVTLIFVEFFLGVMLVCQELGPKKIYLKLVFTTLVLFSIYLIPKVFAGEEENCQCFGDYVEMSPTQAIIKNVILIFLCFFLHLKWNLKSIFFKYKSILYLLAIFFPLSLLFLSKSNEFPLISNDPELKGINLNLRDIEKKTHQNFNLKQKQLVLFFKATCSHCKSTAKQFSQLKKSHKSLEALSFIAGTDAEIKAFLAESNFPLKNGFSLNNLDFSQRVKGQMLPVMYLLKNGKVDKQINAFNPKSVDFIINYITK